MVEASSKVGEFLKPGDLLSPRDKFSYQKEQFKQSPRYEKILQKINEAPRSQDAIGWLGESIQRRLYIGGQGNEWASIMNANSEFGSRCITMVRGEALSVGYDVGNARAWLGRKGVDATENAHAIENVFHGGSKFSDYLFEDEIGFAETAVMVDMFTALCDQERAKIPENPGFLKSSNKAILRYTSAVFGVIGEEMKRSAEGLPMPEAQYYLDVLSIPAISVGIELAPIK